MFYKEMYQELVDHEEVYRRLHPRTSEIDLQVIKKSVYGKNPVQIGMEIPCSEATVYLRWTNWQNRVAIMWQCI